MPGAAATEPPTTLCMITSPDRAGYFVLGPWIRVFADGPQKNPQTPSFDQAPGPGADFIRCPTSPGSLDAVRANVARGARLRARGRPLSAGVRRTDPTLGRKGRHLCGRRLSPVRELDGES